MFGYLAPMAAIAVSLWVPLRGSVSCPTPEGSKYPKTEYIPETIAAIPSIETIYTPYLNPLDHVGHMQGLNGLVGGIEGMSGLVEKLYTLLQSSMPGTVERRRSLARVLANFLSGVWPSRSPP